MRHDRANARLAPNDLADLQDYVIALIDALAPLRSSRAIEEAAVTLLGERIGANRVVDAEIEDEITSARLDYTRGVQSAAGKWANCNLDQAGLFIAPGDTFVWPNVDHLRAAHVRDFYAAAQVQAMIIARRKKNDRVFGYLAVQMATPRAWTDFEVRLVEVTAERLWASIERAELAEELAESEARLTFLLEFSDALQNLAEPSESCGADPALARLRAQLGAYHASLAYPRDGAMVVGFEDREPEAPSVLGVHRCA